MPIDFVYTSQGKYDFFGYTEKNDFGRNYISADLNEYPKGIKSRDYGSLPKVIACTNKVSGGQTCKILSRLAPIGTDNVGRPGNVLAHHMVVENDRQKEWKAGPAWLLKRRAWFDHWDHRGRMALPESTIEENNYVPITSPPTWQKYFPNTWAQRIEELIDALDDQKKKSVFLFDKNVHSTEEILDLFYEALSWAKEEKRWIATFCTYTLDKHKFLSWQWMGIDREDRASLGIYMRSKPLVFDLSTTK